MEGNTVDVVQAVTQFGETVTSAISLQTVASILGVAITAPLAIFLFRWGINMLMSRLKRGLRGRM